MLAASLHRIIMDRGAQVRMWLHNWSRDAAQIMWLVVPRVVLLLLLTTSRCAQPSTIVPFFERGVSVQATLPLQVSAARRARHIMSVVAVFDWSAPRQALAAGGGHDPGGAQGRRDPGDGRQVPV